MFYSIGEFSRLCGINATTLRAWQRRYGLLTPQRTEGGHRMYTDDDVRLALKILDWLRKGVPVSQVKPLLSRPETGLTNNWLSLQEKMLQRLKEGKIDALRQIVYDAGREYPRPELVTEVLRPLRSQLSANIPAMLTLREILDGIIIAYTSFCLEGDKKVAGDNILIGGWLLADPCEVWLEALKRTGKGLRLDVLPRPAATPAPVTFPDKKWLLVTGAPLTAAQAEQFQRWQQQVASLELITLY
ncbi:MULTISPECIES: MerR family transcriptional regulator [Tatumella]|uniref:MerR family transcriptional regulator n=1 Tax=Tatumella punctata TaxID=399969 RepID=A0ABW1VT38_9GAMM|nr:MULTISPECIES: MerR family transcriptional regulator [unclassified Tatumella]MBS0878113.1 MerR family transcriptional regulator [Tatumella sp. JGM82]MBS0890472.1 MerR family transcriptional regulator [Tatumella sp. JGM94]MBS0895163.1 MerR family transcriptional regulator [Tatumella sp. JGM130]MBS0900928.1 MerR family transcriptional regulator [Tatumella sp. JGM100]